MFSGSKNSYHDASAKLAALEKSQATIEFKMDGTILTANKNFCNAMGYSLDEIQGKHHSMFADPAYAASKEYKDFWARLNNGEFFVAEFRRFGKGGKEIWIEASYNPLLDSKGKAYKVVKYATDVTKRKLLSADHEGQVEAIGKSHAVIEFNMDGTIITANENFCSAMGYSLAEIQGKHHSMFAEPAYAASQEYKDFWEKLNRGEYSTGQYKRFGKGGKEIWIEASYNPILTMSGKPFKVVKYATDITKQKLINADFGGQIEAISKSQAVIHFNMDGTILTANKNFCNAMGYSLDEIQGMHHSMFAEPAYAASQEYKDFWAKTQSR
jgi:methyl-accepting chemotaxis protein